MSTYLEAPVQTERRPLSIASTVTRLALIGVALACVAGSFAYLGGWLTPNNLTPARFTDAFQRVDGVHARLSSQPCQRRGRFRLFRKQREWSAFLEGGCLPPRPPARGRALLLVRRPAGRRRQRRCGARPRAPIQSARRRSVANRDDQPAGVPVQNARGVLRAARRLE